MWSAPVYQSMELQHQTEEAQRQLTRSVTPSTHEEAAPLQTQEAEERLAEPQAVSNLLAGAERESNQRRNLALIPILVAAQIALIIAFPYHPVTIYSYIFTVFCIALFGSLFGLRYRKTTMALAQVDDIQMIGPLIDRLRTSNLVERGVRRPRRVVRQALMRLLPRLQASDATRLTPLQKARLAQYLGHLALLQRDKEFQIVILRALEQVGDAQAVPIVEKIIQRKPHWSAQEQVHAAAVECLPFLLQRAQEENSRQTLLRSTSGGDERGGQLLRPAEAVKEIDPHQLLRAEPSQEGEQTPAPR